MRIDNGKLDGSSALKFEALAQELRRRVLSGTWAEGSKLPTERELMRTTGLSLTTVRRAYDALVEEELIVRRRGAGTFVAPRESAAAASALRIGVMLPEAHSYFGTAVRGIEEALTAVGATLALVITEYHAHREDDALAGLLRDGVDGLIVVPVLTQDAALDTRRLERVLEQPVPLVLMERRLPGPTALDDTEHVVSDHAGGAVDAVQRLTRPRSPTERASSATPLSDVGDAYTPVMRLLFVHGAGGFAEDRDLAEALAAALGAALDYPHLPDDDMSFQAWTGPVRSALDSLTADDVVVGHSFGASIAYKVLAEPDRPSPRTMLLAMPFWGPEGWDVAEYHHDGHAVGAPVTLHHCRDDEIVPFDHLALHAAALPRVRTQAHGAGGHQFSGLADNLAHTLRD